MVDTPSANQIARRICLHFSFLFVPMNQTDELTDVSAVLPPVADTDVDSFFDVIPVVLSSDESSPTDDSKLYKSDRIQRRNTGRPRTSPSPSDPVSTPVVERT